MKKSEICEPQLRFYYRPLKPKCSKCFNEYDPFSRNLSCLKYIWICSTHIVTPLIAGVSCASVFISALNREVHAALVALSCCELVSSIESVLWTKVTLTDCCYPHKEVIAFCIDPITTSCSMFYKGSGLFTWHLYECYIDHQTRISCLVFLGRTVL